MRRVGRIVLRVLGTHEMLHDVIRRQAEADLGIKIQYTALEGMSALQRAILSPDSFDIYDQWHSSDLAWTARAVHPIEIDRIQRWGEMGSLSLTGRLDPWSAGGQGDTPGSRLWVQPDGRLGSIPTRFASMVPTLLGADSPAYLPDAADLLGNPTEESWAWLLDDRLNGRVAVMRDPSLGVIELALACQAGGLATFANVADLTIEEIDTLIDILKRKKRAGHFAALWSTFEDSVRMMVSGKVLLQSIWAPAITVLKSASSPVKLSHPVEGSRGWHSGLCLSSRADKHATDAAYEYFNWFLDGWPGAYHARQGYYVSVPGPIRSHLSEAEWAYWYEGETAREDIRSSSKLIVARAGERRDGGSFSMRMRRIIVWNSFMSEHNYLVRRWNEFLAA